jgi:dipeptidyl aminopeptidase/acylaminoacyl peptidase
VNGSGTRQLTHGTGESQGSPHWSPDGRTIAFDAVTSSERHWHIWTIDTDGGAPRQLTQAVGNQTVPTWSHDGRWIYYSADLPGRAERNIWRVPAGGGTPEQITRDGSGYLAIELADGKELMYQASSRDSALFRLPLQGGTPNKLVDCAKSAAYDTSASEIFYVACDRGAEPSLHAQHQMTGRDRVLGTLPKLPSETTPIVLAVSADGATILYVGSDRFSGDLMLIENYR